MLFEVVNIAKFPNVELFRASDTQGRGWNGYGRGYIKTKFIKACNEVLSNCKGKFQLTFHNELTGAAGINMVVIENLPVDLPIVDEPRRLTFKALSRTLGNDGLINMYSMRLASSEDAARLWHMMNMFQFAASEANKGC